MPNMNKIKLPISDKVFFRKEAKWRISLLSEEEKSEAAQSLCKKLLRSPIVQDAQNIIGYQAFGDEIALTPFFETAKKQGKNIFTIDSQGYSSSLPSEGVILVPGRAFTLSGKRIGRGGGWYDTFLAKRPHLLIIWVCFDCQIFPELPQDDWDISMDEIITWK